MALRLDLDDETADIGDGRRSRGGFEKHHRPIWQDVFLAKMEQIVPWAQLYAVIEPHYPRPGKGRPPVGLERMLQMYFVQRWFNLADEACEEALPDNTALRRFVGIDLGRERVPDATTLLKFRRLLAARTGGATVLAGQRPIGDAGAEGRHGDDRGCNGHRRIRCDYECGQGPRSGHAPDAQGPPVVLWDEIAHRRGQPHWAYAKARS